MLKGKKGKDQGRPCARKREVPLQKRIFRGEGEGLCPSTV